MPEHLRALVVILAIATAVFYGARGAVTEQSMSPDQYCSRRNCWFAATLIAFLSHNVWLLFILCAALFYLYGRRDKSPLALYCATLFVLPSLPVAIPGIGSMNFLFEIDHVRLLGLVILLPFAVKLRSQHIKSNVGSSRFPDLCVLGYLAIAFLMQAANDTITNSLRTLFYAFVDVGLPYYVASRALREFGQYRETIVSIVVALAIVAVTAVFESTRFWLLYNALWANALGFPDYDFRYLLRGAGLRAHATTTQPIVLGYLMMVGIALFPILASATKNRRAVLFAISALLAGLVASFSRGPWVGAAIAIAVLICLGPGKSKRTFAFGALGSLTFAILMLSPYGDTVIQYLPFVGNIETNTIDYRVQLWDVSMEVVRQNPWLGDIYFLDNPILEQMRQGQGIIDIVNSYLQLMLRYGVIGLFLFAAPMIYGLWQLQKLRKSAIARGDLDIELLGRVLLASSIGICVTIATVSSINLIPTIYWLVVGMSVGASSRTFLAEASTKHVKPARRSRSYV